MELAQIQRVYFHVELKKSKHIYNIFFYKKTLKLTFENKNILVKILQKIYNHLYLYNKKFIQIIVENAHFYINYNEYIKHLKKIDRKCRSLQFFSE